MPKKLIVIGSGYIGLEFSCIFHNLGAEVHIMFRQDKPLRGFDEEVRSARLPLYMSCRLHSTEIPALMCENTECSRRKGQPCC